MAFSGPPIVSHTKNKQDPGTQVATGQRVAPTLHRTLHEASVHLLVLDSG